MSSYSTSLETMHDLQQLSTVDFYYSFFQILRVFILRRFPGICDAYFLSRFIGGLKTIIQVYVLQHHPITLLDAYELTSIQ